MDGEDLPDYDVFRISGRGKQSAIMAIIFMILFPTIFLTVGILRGIEIQIILLVMIFFSPISIIALIGFIIAIREKTIIIDDIALYYYVGSKMKWKAPLKKIEKIRLYMGGGKTKFPVLKIEGKKGRRMLSGEKVSYEMIRSSFEELKRRLKKKGLAVMIEDEIGSMTRRRR